MLEPGRRVGQYTVGAQIGQGGMAAVYLAHDREGRPWALKVLIQRNDDLRERFCQEAEIQCALDHPHIVRGRERIFVDEDPALVMELVEGRPLDVWLLYDDRPPTDPAAVRDRDRISRQMVDAVGFAHAHGLIHRDLKPGNILIEDRADGPFAKVTDFGLAKQVDGLAATRTGIALGTPRYMAPEQIRDAKRVDARADVWSLGAVLFEMYTGRPAFHRDALIDIYTAVVDGVYPDPAALGVPLRVCEAIRGALRVDLEERFPDCRALMHVLGVEPSYPPGTLPLPLLPSPTGTNPRVSPMSAPGRPARPPAPPRPPPMARVPPLPPGVGRVPPLTSPAPSRVSSPLAAPAAPAEAAQPQGAQLAAAESPPTVMIPERVPLGMAPTLIKSAPLVSPPPAPAAPAPPEPRPSLTDAPVRGVLLPGSRPGEELPPTGLVEESSSVTLLPVSDPRPESDPDSSPIPGPPPPPRGAALIVNSRLPPRRKRKPAEGWPMLTWIVAWAAALLLVVGTFVTGMVVLGGLVTVNELMGEPAEHQAPPRRAPRRGGRR